MQEESHQTNESLEAPKESSSSNGCNDYGSAEYWENRYKNTKGQRFDWLETFSGVHKLILRELGEDKSKCILNIGCGNGEIQDEIYCSGYQNIFNNDISVEVIKQMNEIKHKKEQTKMIYEVMDVTDMAYPSKKFDMVLDKSTIDALLCSEHSFTNTAKMLEEIYRVLKDDGIYLVVSYAGPENRMNHLMREHVKFDIKMEELVRINEEGHTLKHYAYVCRKVAMVERNKEWMEEFYRNVKKEEDEYYA